jgi:hypothetical protein
MDVTQFRQHLKTLTHSAGGVVRWSRDKQVAPSVVSDIISGRRDPTPKVLEAARFVLVKDYISISAEGTSEW